MKFYSVSPLILQKLIWIPTRLILKLCGKLEIKGLGNLKGVESGASSKLPVIFACNHSSEIDPFMVPASLPFFSRFSPLFYAVREKAFYDSNGWRKHLFNTWFINAGGGYGATVGLRNYELSLSRHIKILHDGHSFCVFPEGGITKDGHIQPAKGGISFLAHSAPCVIVPVAISGAFGMSPADFFSRKRKITIHFGTPIPANELYAQTQKNESALPHQPNENVWKKEADFIMKKVGELLV